MNKRIWIAILLLGLLTVMLCACTPQTGPATDSESTVQTTVPATPAVSDSENTEQPQSDEPDESFVPSDDLDDENWTPNY